MPAAAAVRLALRRTPAAPVTTPAASTASGLLIAKLVLAVMAVMTEPAGMPVPVTTWPTARPAVLAVVMTFWPATPPVAVAVPAARTAVMVVPTGTPAPRTVWPIDKPATSARATLFEPLAPLTIAFDASRPMTAAPLVARAAISNQPAATVVVPV